MATVVNNPNSDSSGNAVLILGIVLILGVLAALYFGLPYLRGPANTTREMDTTETQPNGGMNDDSETPTNVQNNMMQPQGSTAPADNNETNDTNIMIPDRIDVNVNGNVGGSAQPSSMPSSQPAQ